MDTIDPLLPWLTSLFDAFFSQHLARRHETIILSH
jgi:hypothetical protein